MCVIWAGHDHAMTCFSEWNVNVDFCCIQSSWATAGGNVFFYCAKICTQHKNIGKKRIKKKRKKEKRNRKKPTNKLQFILWGHENAIVIYPAVVKTFHKEPKMSTCLRRYRRSQRKHQSQLYLSSGGHECLRRNSDVIKAWRHLILDLWRITRRPTPIFSAGLSHSWQPYTVDWVTSGQIKISWVLADDIG